MAESKNTALLQELRTLLATDELPELGPQIRPGVKTVSALNQELQPWLKRAKVSPEAEAKIRCATLLWHDHLEESHLLAQNINDQDGSLLHGLMHRREPDASNAKYWFHRVGSHACFPEIAQQAAAWLEAREESHLKHQLIPHGDWDPFTFVDACNGVSSPAHKQLLQEVQRIEFEVLLEHLYQHG